MKRVLVIGGYGNFGRFIARALASEANLSLIIAGRDLDKAKACAASVNGHALALDINDDLTLAFQTIAPDIVIHTSGPFQGQGYQVARACIASGAHYIDLADSRAFVVGIDALADSAKGAGVLVVSGASSVPCFTSALVDDC